MSKGPIQGDLASQSLEGAQTPIKKMLNHLLADYKEKEGGTVIMSQKMRDVKSGWSEQTVMDLCVLIGVQY